MSEGDDALGRAACKVGGRALMVHVVSGPAVPAAPAIRAVAGLVPGVLAMAFEAVDVGWKSSLALPKGATRWGPWIFYHLSLKAIFPFTVFWVAVGGSLCRVNARDDAARGGSGMSAKEVGDQTRSDCCMCQVAFHLVLFLFGFELLSP